MKFSIEDNLVLGTAGLGGVWGKVDPEASVKTILQGLKQGISAIDTAPAYGHAEVFVGEALNQWTGNKPLISTKVGRLKSHRADEAYYDYSSGGMKSSVEHSLKTLGIAAADLLFLHDPSAISAAEIEGVLQQMQDFKSEGYARRIGLGGNVPNWMEPYLQDNPFDVVMEYNKLNACCIDALRTTVPFYLESGKEYYAASPLNMGLLGCNFSRFTTDPPEWLDLKNIEQAKEINSIAYKYNMPLQVLAHRFFRNIPYPIKTVIGAANQQQLTDTLLAFGAGSLPTVIYHEILQVLNKNADESDR
jgi:aryl-alcohol dehydrogenase-like predicted oxidoreductase